MKTALPFRELSPAPERVEIRFDGAPLALPPGANLAAALLAAGAGHFRTTPVSGAPRAPFCMMGACYDCLVVIEGAQVQACMTQVEAGMVVTRAPLREAGLDD
ncbi:MAG: 2Fe-2S iron-sulfur cluster-binding protein [Kiloniellales bacterium]